uniref:Uncharacterized protein n=1 Tax=Setaria viridis TaxID=4556 RepID=A0A4V6DFX0_SETVI|nr:hypothetical protein SEVIR_1G358050v2 [Setaria viridis]
MLLKFVLDWWTGRGTDALFDGNILDSRHIWQCRVVHQTNMVDEEGRAVAAVRVCAFLFRH